MIENTLEQLLYASLSAERHKKKIKESAVDKKIRIQNFVDKKIYKKKSAPKKRRLKKVLSPYQQYLKSSKWKKISKAVKERDNNQCVKCQSKENLNVHHLTYDNIFNEQDYLEDLTCVCKTCHENIHKRDKESLDELFEQLAKEELL